MTTTKRGRKAGSGSFVSIPLAELNAVLKPTANVIVWSRFADALSLTGRKVSAKADQLVSSVEGGKTAPELEVFDTDIKDAVPVAPTTLPSGERPDLVPRPSVHLTQW